MERNRGDLEAELRQFCWTERYHKHGCDLLYTDGVRHLAERGGAYWLLDLVGSYQPKLDAPFQLWSVSVHEDRSALVTMAEDSGAPILVSQKIPSTDFPLRELSFYVIDGVMMLKGEY